MNASIRSTTGNDPQLWLIEHPLESRLNLSLNGDLTRLHLPAREIRPVVFKEKAPSLHGSAIDLEACRENGTAEIEPLI